MEKFFRYICILFLLVDSCLSIVVTRFDGIEDYYIYLRRNEPWNNKTSPSFTNSLKDAHSVQMYILCTDVLQSRYFQLKNEFGADLLVKETGYEMLKYYRQIFHFHFEKVTDYRGKWTGYHDLKTLSYKTLPIKVRGVRTNEYLFSCLARNGQTNVIRQYFISSGYYDNDMFKFLFSYNSIGDLVVEAVIDNNNVMSAGEGFTLDSLEFKYLKRTKFNLRKIPKKENSICKLSDDAKLRACAWILDLDSYRVGYKNTRFWPTKFNVDYVCRKRSILFTKSENYKGQKTDEWMFACKTRIAASQKRQIIYISYSYDEFSVFTYVNNNIQDNKTVYLQDHVINI